MTDSSIQGTPGEVGTVVLDEGVHAQVDAELAQLRADVDAANARAEAAEKAAEGKTPLYAVYDETYERYVGNPHDTRAKATKAAKDAGVKRARVDEVYR